MLNFESPILLLALAPVAAAAALALLRPQRPVISVAAISLWRRAADATGPASARPVRRATLSWLLLLLGAAAGVIAAAGPTLVADRPVRHVAVGAAASADVSADTLQQAAAALLRRLDRHDRVQFVLSDVQGGATPFMSRDEAMARAAALRPVAALGDQLSLGEPSPQAQRLFVLTDTPAAVREGVLLQLPAQPPVANIRRLAAEQISPNQSQVLIAVANNSPRELEVRLRVYDAAAAAGELAVHAAAIAAGGEAHVVLSLPPAEAIGVDVLCDGDVADTAVVARQPSRASVAIVGRDEPLLRRFIEAHGGLELIADGAAADLMFAVGTDPPAGKPALAFFPPSPPAGGQAGEVVGPLLLRDANIADDDHLMRDVDLSAVAVREAQPWTLGRRGAVVSYGDVALIFRDEGDGETPPRVYVAFDPAGDNTNWGLDESFVILMANAVEVLLGQREAGEYGFDAPMDVHALTDSWELVHRGGAAGGSGVLPAPGLYREASGALRAVSLVGARAAGGGGERPVLETIAALDLPQPAPLASPRQAWPALAALAGALWLAGWAVSARRV